ncbi:MAG: RidA family protein [Faecalicoccus sp.]|nr:RidA family protein [Faecalicoccus sp.]
MFEYTNIKEAPAAVGPYSQAVKSGNMLFISGQIGIDPATNEMVEANIETQAHQVMKNIGKILEANDMDYSNVIKTTCLLADLKDFGTFNGIYEQYFISKPARSCFAAAGIPKGALCEVEVIAVKD